MTEYRVVVDIDDVCDHSELQEEVGVGGIPPSNVEIREAVWEKEEPNEDDDHKAGQTAQRVQASRRLEDGGVKTRSKLK